MVEGVLVSPGELHPVDPILPQSLVPALPTGHHLPPLTVEQVLSNWSGTLARRSSLPQRGMPSDIPGRPVPTGWDSHSIAGGPLPPLKQTPTSRPPSSLASLRCPALPDLVNVAPPLPGVPSLPPIPPPPTALHWSPRVDRNTLKAGLGCIFLGQNMAYN